jgi:hypothetical protein
LLFCHRQKIAGGAGDLAHHNLVTTRDHCQIVVTQVMKVIACFVLQLVDAHGSLLFGSVSECRPRARPYFSTKRPVALLTFRPGQFEKEAVTLAKYSWIMTTCHHFQFVVTQVMNVIAFSTFQLIDYSHGSLLFVQ